MQLRTLTKGFNRTEAIIAKTMEYLSIPSVVGHEHFFLNHLYEDFKKLGLDAKRHEGLLEISGDKPYSAIVCAHIDRHGLVSIGNDEYAYAAQYVREIKYGEENRSSRKDLMGIAERFEGERLYAYCTKTGVKIGEGTIKASHKAMDNGDSIFFVDGLDEHKSGVPLAYARTAKAKDGMLKGQIDNTISIGVVYALFKAGFQGTAFLTCEEEIGKSWVHIARHLEREKIETKNLVIIDTSPYKEEGPIDEGTIILRNRDRFAVFNTELLERFKERCDDLEIPYQVKDEILLAAGKDIDDLGSTELGRLIKEKNERWSGATVQIPTTMYHTSFETTSYLAVKNYFKFLKDILVEDQLDYTIKKG